MDEGEIRKFIRANLKYFGREGLGWPRPGGLPKYYAQHPEEWLDDLAMAGELRRKDAAQAKAAAADQARGGPTASSGMSEATRALFESVKTLYAASLGLPEIASRLSMPERCVRNALALGHNADTPHTEARDHGPEVERYLGANYRWPGVNGRSNGH